MLKEKLKVIFNYLPPKLQIFAFYFYKIFALKENYNSPDHFPLNYQKKIKNELDYLDQLVVFKQ